MNGKKSIFYKYFAICTVSVVVGILLIGITLFVFMLQYFQGEKYESLEKNVRNAGALTLSNYAANGYRHLDYSAVSNGYKLLSMATDSEIFFVNASGRTLICSEDGACIHTTYMLPETIIERALQDDFKELGNLDGLYKSTYYTVGKPLRVENGKTIGVVFISTSADSFTQFMSRTFRNITICALVVLLLSFLLSYYVTSRMVRPIRQMVQATRSFSKGDFTQRIATSDETEIGKLAEAFNSMATDLAQLETSRRSFIANVSHELKTPMTTMIGFVEGILDGTIPSEQHEHYLKIVLTESQRLSRLVRAMLDIARMEAGERTLNPSTFDINEIVCQALFSFERQIDAKRLNVHGLDNPDKLLVTADEDLIHQVVYNLIDNAVKFANEEGYIAFKYTQVKNTMYISVKNSGEGITDEEAKQIFERFYKTDRSRNRDKHGVGLGLHIVKSVINLHGGDIRVFSRKGEYTEFVFTLPVAQKKNYHK